MMRTLMRTIRRRAAAWSLLVVTAGAVACSSSSFDIPNGNAPTINSVLLSPTRSKLSQVATGILYGAKEDMIPLIWQMGTFGREGYNLQGNDPRSTGEALTSLDASSFIGGGLWLSRYANIRLINTYLTALATVPSSELSASEAAASRGFANTYKALAFTYVILSRQELGAPVDVGGDPTSTTLPPFVSQDAVYQKILVLLDSARTDLQTAGTTAFPFTLGGAMSAFSSPATFLQFNRALYAKALVMRATNVKPNACPTCFATALTVLTGTQTFIDPTASLQLGAYHPFSPGANDIPNTLADPLNSNVYFVHPSFATDAQTQADGTTPDARLTSKTAAFAGGTYTLNALTSDLKWTTYFNGGSPNQSAPIPIIKNEELLLLRAEANIGLANYDAARTDINTVRTISGGLAPIAPGGLTAANAVTELLYNRRYSLAWEQGVRWIDARRYGRLGTLPIDRDADATFPRMPIPQAECQARGLSVVIGTGCNPGGFALNP
jgi:hypothetical protein